MNENVEFHFFDFRYSTASLKFSNLIIAGSARIVPMGIPFIDLHLSNTFAREEFRHKSYFSDIAQSCLFGFGAYGYELALHAADQHIASVEED